MKKIIKRLGIWALAATMLLVGCVNNGAQGDGTTDVEDVKFLELDGYTIIRGESEPEDVTAAIADFYFKLKNEMKLNVSYVVDIDAQESEKEIVFGTTTRSTDKNHRYSDWSVEYKAGKLYICGGSAEAIKKATEWLCEECIADGVVSLEKIPYEYNATYSMENLKVSGVSFSEFAVLESEGDADDALRKWLGSRTGMRKTSPNGYVIKVVADNTLNFNEISIELVGKELLLSASAHLGDLSVVTDFFLDAIKTRSSDDLEFNGKEEIEMPEPTVTLKDVREVSATTKIVNVETDKDPLSYEVGDEIVFICSLYADKTLVSCPQFSWNANTSDGMVYFGEAGGAFGKVIVKIPATAVGGVRLKVVVKDEYGATITDVNQDVSFSAIVNAADITTQKEEPSDFDAFWAAEIAKVMAVNPDVLSMEKVTSPTNIQTMDGAAATATAHDFYRVKIKTPDECGYAIGYLTIPKNATSVGITVNFNGYGVRDMDPYISPTHIVFNVCAHAHELGREASYYNGLLANYGFTGNESRDTSYFRTMIMRDIQAVRFVKAYAGTEGVNINGQKSALGIWNGTLRVHGGSQGGFQSIAIAALDKDVTEAYLVAPWLCDVGGTASEFRPKYTSDLRYFDSVYFSKRIDDKVKVTIVAGLGDYICPPSGIVALYNATGGSVTMYFKQGMTHGYTPSNASTTMYKK